MIKEKLLGNQNGMTLLGAIGFIAMVSGFILVVNSVTSNSRQAVQLNEDRIDFLIWKRGFEARMENSECMDLFGNQNVASLVPRFDQLAPDLRLPAKFEFKSISMSSLLQRPGGAIATLNATVQKIASSRSTDLARVFKVTKRFAFSISPAGIVAGCSLKSKGLRFILPIAALTAEQSLFAGCEFGAIDNSWRAHSACYRYCGQLGFYSGQITQCNGATAHCVCIP